jgi:hypothetical protein
MPTATKPPPTRTRTRAGHVKRWYLDPARDAKDRSIISGLIAALIFFVIDVVTGGGVVSAIGLAVIIGVGTVAVSFVISRSITTNLRRRS